MTVQELKHLIDLLCTEKIDRELHYGQYDVRESILAINGFHGVSQEIDTTDINHYLQQLTIKVKERQGTLSAEMSGEYNGGKGSWGCCLAEVEQMIAEGVGYNRLKWRLTWEILLIKIGVFGLWSNWRIWLVISLLLSISWLAIV